MAFPAGITTRAVTLGPGVSMEAGDALSVKAGVRASSNLVWGPTGTAVRAVEKTYANEEGLELEFPLPVTDQSGWMRNGELVDVTGGKQSHYYVISLEFYGAGNRLVSTDTIGPIAIPTGDGSPIDADKLIPASTPGGATIAIPDAWSEAVALAQAAATEAAQAMIDSDAFMATTMADPESLTAQAVSASNAATNVAKSKEVFGGQFPKPLRVPTLVTERAWPNNRGEYRIMAHADAGQTLWAFGWDSTVRKSLDGGLTWAKKAYQAFGFNIGIGFLRTNAGALLGMRTGSTAIVMRSTDDGATWTTVTIASARSAHYPMGSQSWTVDPATGYIYYGEYTTVDNLAELYLFRSTDDGASFSVFHTFPGYAATGNPDKVRHIHSVQWDHVQQRVVAMLGDSDPAAGMYRVNAAGTAMEPMLLNRDIPSITDGARAIGIIPFPDYICWTNDTTGNPYLMRIARSELGKSSPVVERIYRMNTSGWFTCKASANGSRWIFTSSQESQATRIDTSAHVYAVEDQGATVYEVGSVPTESTGLATLSPVGMPHENGDVFFLQSHNMAPRFASWRLRLSMGAAALDWPDERPATYNEKTFSSGSVAVPAGGSVVFGHDRVPSLARVLYILDAGVIAQSGTAASARVHVRQKGVTPSFWQGATVSERQSQHMETGGVIFSKTDLAAAADIEFVITSSADAYTGTAFVKFAWGF